MSIINDKLGPSNETYFDGAASYTIKTTEEGRLALGLRLGGRLFNIDWSKGSRRDSQDALFSNNINNRFLPTVGAGVLLLYR